MMDIDVQSANQQDHGALPVIGYNASRINAVRHGILSRFTVLPWEDETEYEALLHALTEEHGPAGPTETHLVVELASVLWRKRRLRLAEISTYQRGLQATTGTYSKTAQAALAASTAIEPANIRCRRRDQGRNRRSPTRADRVGRRSPIDAGRARNPWQRSQSGICGRARVAARGHTRGVGRAVELEAQ